MSSLTSMLKDIHVSNKDIALFAIGLVTLRFVFYVIYRIWFHPLSKIPGPSLAACTYLVEFYYNVVKDGSYYEHIAQWHKTYGPLIRVTPDEVHVSDPEAYDTIYHMGTGFHKDPSFYGHFTGDERTMIFMMTNNQLARASRAPLNSLFAKRSVDDLENFYRLYADKLCDRIRASGSHADVRDALGCYVIDSLSRYCFGVSFDLLDAADFSKGYFDMILQMNACIWPFRMLPKWFIYRLTHMPVVLGPFPMRHMQNICTKQLADIREARKSEKEAGEKSQQRTIFHELMDAEIKDENGNKHPYTEELLISEAMEIVIAGAGSTANVLATAILGILSQKEIHAALRSELLEAFPDGKISDGRQLENLSFLTACIKETLRVSVPVMGRLPRVVDTPFFEINGVNIPQNSIVSQSAYFLHFNEAVFPSPELYIPDRWLDRPDLDKHIAPFSRGHRSCLGMQLAWNQLYWAIGSLILRFETLRLAHNSVQRVEDVRKVDYFITFPKSGTPTLRVEVD